MKTLALLACGLFSVTAFAEVKEGGNFHRYWIDQPGSFRFRVVQDLKTRDACNTFGLGGILRSMPGESERAHPAFLADLAVSQSSTICRELAKPRQIALESEVFEISPVDGHVNTFLLVPAGMRIREE